MRTPTDYTNQRNRCPRCGHRLTMVLGGPNCQVVTGDPHDPTIIERCRCRRHHRRG